MPGCGKCGRRLDIVGNQVGRRDTCPGCDAELHACIHCRHFDPGVAKQCKEPFAEVPMDKESANFCELFQIGDGGQLAGAEREALLSAAEALFKKR
ncbi:MAG: hypothetical protein IRZ16_18620 [Myxococcaceae bacterium]|nr:hypothetical protein [Myxococcaceae bacterium]